MRWNWKYSALYSCSSWLPSVARWQAGTWTWKTLDISICGETIQFLQIRFDSIAPSYLYWLHELWTMYEALAVGIGNSVIAYQIACFRLISWIYNPVEPYFRKFSVNNVRNRSATLYSNKIEPRNQRLIRVTFPGADGLEKLDLLD